jgi:hypothetical protein
MSTLYADDVTSAIALHAQLRCGFEADAAATLRLTEAPAMDE